jgi:hypothetical protein
LCLGFEVAQQAIEGFGVGVVILPVTEVSDMPFSFANRFRYSRLQ